MIYSAHIGPIDAERRRCLDRQKEVYGDGCMLIQDDDWFDGKDVRSAMDRYRLELIRSGGGWIDSDVFPESIEICPGSPEFITGWQPPEDGIWLSNSWGWPRIDYWAIFNRNCNEYIEAMLEYCDKEQPPFMWPLKYFLTHPESIKMIPMEAFNHLYLTTSTNGVKP